MPKVDINAIPVVTGSAYPGKHAAKMAGRSQWPLGAASGITQFGANLVRLDPGAMSALRHWHEQQDEFLVVTEGELTLIEDDGEKLLRPGDCAAFPAGVANGHHLVNKSSDVGAFVVVGTHTEEEVGHYSDVDMMVRLKGEDFSFTRKDGSPVTEDD